MSTCSGTHAHDYSANNAQYFNDTAHTYDDQPHAVELARKFANDMRKAYPFDAESTTLMDYACGTGLMSRELAPYTKKIVGVDISQNMVDQFNLRVQNQGISLEEMQAVCTPLKGEEGELDGAKFDVVVCASAYHHFASIEEVTRTLAFFLKPGGSLLVADVGRGTTSGEIFPQEFQHLVAHLGGFEEGDIKSVFEGAGLGDFTFKKVARAKAHGRDVELFLAKGVKSVDKL